MHITAPIKPPARNRKRRKNYLLRFIAFTFTAGVIVFLAAAAVAAYFLWQMARELPDYEVLANYEPAVMTRIHANDGSLIAEYARERRIYVPINTIPEKLIRGFLSAEDKNFYEHGGLDFQGILRAVRTNVQNYGSGRRPQGASTITQQVAKNFFKMDEAPKQKDKGSTSLSDKWENMRWKIKEAILAIRIERAFAKEKILELYLNEIYLGNYSYGVAAAALNYFGKELHELTTEEIAYLAALPKAPSHYHPYKNTAKAIERRNWVISRMVEDRYVSAEEGRRAREQPLNVNFRPLGAHTFAAEYFAEEVRRTLLDMYGEQKLYSGGLSVRSTIDPVLQQMARAALREGLLRYDRRQGWRGPEKKIDAAGDWGATLADMQVLQDLDPWRLGVVLEVSKDKAVVGLQPVRQQTGEIEKARGSVTIPFQEMKWARPAEKAGDKKRLGKQPQAATDVVAVGDVIYVAPPGESDDDQGENRGWKAESAAAAPKTAWRLVQIPEVEGAIAVLDPHTGRVLALVGGFSFAESQFDRAVQAKRQPGSAFKPFVYAAALDNGYTPSSIVLDAPVAIEQGGGQGLWRPENYEDKFYGPSTLRLGLEKSRNLMTVRLAQDLGMPVIREYSRRFGVYDNLIPVLSMALGAGETTLLRLTTAYCSFANGGKQVRATLIDRIQNRYGKTIWRHDARECPGCRAPKWEGQDEPELADERRQIVDPHTAYQITSMLEGVVRRGTGYQVAKIGKPLAGKTGTTNDEKDAWFVGFAPDLAVGVFVGFDTPTPMGKGETGGGTAAPVFRDFMKLALAGKLAAPFRVPSGIKLVRINAKTGMRAQGGEENTILEAFKPNDEPPDALSYVTYPGADGSQDASDGQGGYRRPGSGYPGQDHGGPGHGGQGPGYGRQPQAGGLY